MPAEQPHASVTYLEPVPDAREHPAPDARDDALAELALALDTQRSANKALLDAVKGLDGMLAEQREHLMETEEHNRHLEDQLGEYATAVTEQVAENKRLWCDVRVAEHRLAEELEKPAWRRLLRR